MYSFNSKKINLLFLLSLVLLWACGGKSGQNPASGRKSNLIIQILSDPMGMNPINSFGADATYIQSIVFDHLIELDFESLEIRPQLAESLPVISDDRKSMVFKLKKNILFADNKPLNAKDVVFSFKALMNPFVDSAPKRAELQHFTDCEAIDDFTVKFSLENAGPFDLSRMAINFFVLPKHIYDPLNLSDAYTGAEAKLAEQHPDSVSPELQHHLSTFAEYFEDEKFQREKGFVIGSGRYNFDGWESGQSLRLVKNKNYWNKDSQTPSHQQNLDTITYRIITKIQTAFQSLKSGEIDFGYGFTPEQYVEKMTGSGFDDFFDKENVPYPYYEYIGWNTKIRNSPQRNFFADYRVRQAMSHLIDVDEIIQNILKGTAKPISSMVYHNRPEHNNKLTPYSFNEEKGKAMLFEAGWMDSDGDGVLNKMVANENVDFAFTLYYRRGNELRQRIAQQVQGKMKKFGIQIEVQDLDWTVMVDRLKKHELDAWLGAWVYDSDEQDLYSLFHSSQILNEGYNWTSYNNPEADRIMEQIIKEWDQEKRFQLHRRIQEILYIDQPYTLLFANAARIAYNNRLKTNNWYGQRPCFHPGEFMLSKSPN